MHKIIQGIRNTDLSEKLQPESKITLSLMEEKVRAAKKIRQSERQRY